MTSSDTKRGWWERLLALGEHNKAIAVATLLTIATGVWVVVSGAIEGVAGDDAEPVTAADFQAAMTAAIEAANQRYEQEGLLDAGVRDRRDGVEGSSGLDDSRGVRSAAADAFEDLRAAATSPQATAAERARIMQAVLDFGRGDSVAALRELERIARGLEGRGALEDAAATWRKRGFVQWHTDPAAALEDFRHAERIAPGGAADEVHFARLLRRLGENEDGCNAARRAVRKARAEEDRELLAAALLMVGETSRVSWADDEAFVREKIDSLTEARDLYLALMAEQPEELRFVREYSNVVYWHRHGPERAGVAAEKLVPGIAELTPQIERVEALDPATVSHVERAITLMSLYASVGDFRKHRIWDAEDAEKEDLHREWAAGAVRFVEEIESLAGEDRIDLDALAQAVDYRIGLADSLRERGLLDELARYDRATMALTAQFLERVPPKVYAARGFRSTILQHVRGLLLAGEPDEALELCRTVLEYRSDEWLRWDRLSFALVFASHGDRRGLEFVPALNDLAAETDRTGRDSLRAAKALALLGDPRAVEYLAHAEALWSARPEGSFDDWRVEAWQRDLQEVHDLIAAHAAAEADDE